MRIPLTEPTSTRYICINPATNQVHLLVPFVGGQGISTDNTCKSEVELKAFFEGGAVSELESYKSTLEFHISLLAEGDAHRLVKEARLSQINTYLEAVIGMRNSYKVAVATFLSQPSNLYSIQLRPRTQDPYSRVVNPVFTVNRGNNSITGTPLSPLYNEMQALFPSLVIGKLNPHQTLISAFLADLPEAMRSIPVSDDTSFLHIQDVLTAKYIEQLPKDIALTIQDDFFKHVVDRRREEVQTVNKAYIDGMMAFSGDETPKDYVAALLRLCVPSLETSQEGSPFYQVGNDSPDKPERLSIMTQFYLGVMNVYCRAKGISDRDFGEVLDSNAVLSKALVTAVSKALSSGGDVEGTLVAFFNAHAGKAEFDLSNTLTPADKEAIQQKFEITYRTVTATKENPHMDDFMLLDTEARGENDKFFTQKGLICTDFANIVPTGPHQEYFNAIRQEAAIHPDIITPQDELVITVDIEPEALMDKLSDAQWETLPKEIVDACRALPAFKARQFLDDVAKGKQNEANAILQASDDIQTLLRTPGKFTDYSGRIFHCTAYEYAWWAKDTHMRRMLESHMNDETKTQMLEQIDAIERLGLAYQQHGVPYKNPHYDMSFVLKNLNPDEFHHLKTLVGQRNAKINSATADNYQTIPFTATEYEQLKKELAQQKVWSFMPNCSANFQFLCYLAYPVFFIASLFITSPAEKLSNKFTRAFDFHSLITAYETYVTHYDRWGDHERDMAWLEVGMAQRDVPAHVAHEYCRPDRSFDQRPEFNEENLPRNLKFYNYNTGVAESWFPLGVSASSGLGFDFALFLGRAVVGGAEGVGGYGGSPLPGTVWLRLDLAAVSHLDEVRTADLTQSREILEMASPNHGLRL